MNRHEIDGTFTRPKPDVGVVVSGILRRCRRFVRISSAGGLLLGSLAAQAQTPGPAAPADDAATPVLQEVTVTAQRRSQSVQDIPYNITAVDGAALSESGAVSLNDLARVVPGLTTVDEGASARGGNNNLTLRGLRTDAPGGGQQGAETPNSSVSPVSTYFGETPVFFPMPLYDVNRVEVLRGPQGTLYGSGSEAGTIRFVPNRPDFHQSSGEIQLDGSKSEHSDDPGRSVIAIGNLPITDQLAARAVAGRIHEGGYIDNVSLWKREGSGIAAVPTPKIPGDLTSGPVILPVERDTNYSDRWFARGELRWAPTDAVDVEIDYLHQHVYANNSSVSNPGFPGSTFDMTTPVPGPVTLANPSRYPNSAFYIPAGGTYRSTAFSLTPYSENIDLVSAVESIDLGLATVTSASSYYNNRSASSSDFTSAFDNPAGINLNLYPPYNFYPRLLADQTTQVGDRAFIQELRVVSSGQHMFDYVAGVYYQHELGRELENQFVPGIISYLSYIGQPSASPLGDESTLDTRSTAFNDTALFGELTYHATSRWQITGGVRGFHQSFGLNNVAKFSLCGAACSADGVNPLGLISTNTNQRVTRAIEKINTSYDISSGLKIYATYSEGFRRGGANAVESGGYFASLPLYQTFTPDVAKNYEIGVKGSAFEHRLRFSGDIYRIDLNDFQFDANNLSGFPVTFNGKRARSQGVELELQAALTHSTSMTVGYGYTDAKVTQTFDVQDYPPYALYPALGGTGQVASIFGAPITAGTPLPGVPKNTASASLDQVLHLTTGARDLGALTLHIDGAYRSASDGAISPSSAYFWVIPSSFIGNFRAIWDATDKTSYQAYINNFTSSPGYSGGAYAQAFENYARFRNVARPRTYGLQIRYKF